MVESLLKLFEDVWSAVAIASRVVLWIDWVHYDKHGLALSRLRVERHFTLGVDSI